jgi:3-oxoacyl-[acyl-carrier protein] reductase
MKRVAVVSGGTRGLGAAIVERLLDDGWCVATFSRSGGAARGRRLMTAAIDARDTEKVKGFLGDVHRRHGRIDALVNNSAIAGEALLTTARERDLVELIEVNLTAPLLLTKAALKYMLADGNGGRILSVSSIVGRVGVTGVAAYAATKAALEGMTRALAREYGPLGVTVNAIAPGYLETDMTAGMAPAQRERIARRTPLGRLGRPTDVAAAASWLLSPDAGFITGQVLVVDGGFTC